MAGNPYTQYQVTRVQTASPEQLLLMLFDGAIRYLQRAQEALKEDAAVGGETWIRKAAAILDELDHTLNPEAGGEVADNLHRLYAYCHYRLIQARTKGDDAACAEVARLLRELRSGFQEAARALRAAAPAQAVGGKGPAHA